jgi:Ca2+-binding RTX toxin-like protein
MRHNARIGLCGIEGFCGHRRTWQLRPRRRPSGSVGFRAQPNDPAGGGNDTFSIGSGSDTVYGGSGNNTYTLTSAAGTGSDVINNDNPGTAVDVLDFAVATTPADVAASRSGNNLVLTVGSSSVTVENYFLGTAYQVALDFADGTSWGYQDVVNAIEASTGIYTQNANPWIATGGAGNDTFIMTSNLLAGSSLTGGSGTDNTLKVNGGNDIYQASISNIQTLQTDDVSLTAAQFNAFNAIQLNTASQGFLLGTTGGTYDLSSKSSADFSLVAESNSGTTLIGNDANYEYLDASATGNDTLIAGNGNSNQLFAGSGNDTLRAGNGDGDMLYAADGTATLIVGNGSGDLLYAGTGIDTLISGSGNDTFYAYSGLAAGSAVTGGGGNDTLYTSGDISGASITNVQMLIIEPIYTVLNVTPYLEIVPGNITLTAAQLNGFSTVGIDTSAGSVSGNFTINAATAGTYSLIGKTTSAFDMVAQSNGGTTLIGNGAAGETLTASASGNDTLTAGNGAGDVLVAGGGNDAMTGGTGGATFDAGAGNDTMTATGGNNVFNFASASATSNYTINDYHTDSGASTIELAPGVTASDVVASRSGNDLVLTIGADPITVQNYFLGADYQIGSVQFSNGTSWSNAYILSQFTATTDEWAGATGTWTDATRWVGGTAPLATGDAELGGTAAYTVTASTAATINNLTISDASAVLNDTGSLIVNGALVDDGAIVVNGGALTVAGAVSGAGSLTINGGTVELGGADAGTVTFAGAGTLKLDAPQDFTGTLAGLLSTDTLDLGGVSVISALISGNVLTVDETGGSSLTFDVTGVPAGATVNVASDGHGGSDVSFAPAVNDATLGSSGNNVTGVANEANVFTATNGTLNAGDVITGATPDAWTSNTLALSGGGTFDLTQPTTLTGIQTIDTQEGSGADAETVILRDGLNATVNVANGADPGTDGLTIDEGNAVDTVNLGTGQDMFVAQHGIAGTVINGTGANSTLSAAVGDIAGMTINDVSNLYLYGDLTLSHAQFDEFTSLNSWWSNPVALQVGNAGTYDLATKTFQSSGPTFSLDATTSTGAVTLIGNDQNNQNLTAGSGTDTLIAGNGNNATLTDGAGVDTLTGGTGNDTFAINHGTAGTTITGGGGNDVLDVAWYVSDIAGMTVSGVQTLDVNGNLALTHAQFDGFSSINGYNWGGTNDTLQVADAGTYDLTTKTYPAGGPTFSLDATTSTGAVTLIGNGQDNQNLTAGSGNDTLIAGNGNNATLTDGAGVDTLIGGTGNDTFYLYNGTAGDTITGGGGNDTLYLWQSVGDITGMTISGIQTLDLNGGGVTLTNAQFDEFTSLDGGNGWGNNLTLTVSDAGAYDLSTKSYLSSGPTFSLDASQSTGAVTITGSDQDNQILTAGSGTDTLQAGNGANDTLTGGAGANTLIAGTGNDILTGGTGTTAYQFGSSFGQDTINNYGSANTPKGEIDFTGGITLQDLWLEQNGNNLVIDRIGTTDSITVANYFNGDTGNQVQSISAGGLSLAIDTQFAQMVQEMATYEAANSGFNPSTATAMPTDSTLQAAITAAWHHA